MTAQIAERLRYDGRPVGLCAEPLEPYFAASGIKPAFALQSTALWRGYVGDWEIVDGRLYLVGLDANLTTGEKATIAMLFPGETGPVFAQWYSGTLRCIEGELVEYRHMGYGSTYEREIFIDVEAGVVKSVRLQETRPVAK